MGDNGPMPNPETNFSLRDGNLRLKEEVNEVGVEVIGQVRTAHAGNADRKRKRQDWKARVACAVKDERGGAKWDHEYLFAITLQFSFHPDNRGPAQWDVENYVKPVVDAVAAGLFCEEHEDPREIQRWGHLDSNFRTLLIHRRPDPPSADQEGVHIFVSSRRP